MLTVCCVLRSGGDFDVRYVKRLWHGVRGHLQPDGVRRRFVCLTDRPASIGAALADEVEAIQLEHEWPGWWSKIEAFKLTGPVLYLDLDTVVVGDLEPIVQMAMAAKQGTLVVLRDFYRGGPASGVMAWSGDWTQKLFERFEEQTKTATWSPARVGPSVRIGDKRFRGDQDWIASLEKSGEIKVAYAQDLCDGIVSFKADVLPRKGVDLPEGARLVAFHGVPRPSRVHKVEWLRTFWGEPFDA